MRTSSQCLLLSSPACLIVPGERVCGQQYWWFPIAAPVLVPEYKIQLASLLGACWLFGGRPPPPDQWLPDRQQPKAVSLPAHRDHHVTMMTGTGVECAHNVNTHVSVTDATACDTEGTLTSSGMGSPMGWLANSRSLAKVAAMLSTAGHSLLTTSGVSLFHCVTVSLPPPV